MTDESGTSDTRQRLLGVCILSWNSGDVLTRCVAQTLLAVRDLSAVIVVVDNKSSDTSIQRLMQLYPGIDVIVNSENVGYARGNNIGAQKLLDLGCEYLLFVNPDVIITKDTVGQLLGAMAKFPRAGCAGGKQSAWTTCFRNKPTVTEKLLIYGRLRDVPVIKTALRPLLERLKASHYGRSETARAVYAVWGPCVLFRAKTFSEVDGFDKGTFLYEEELIMSERLHTKGWEVICVPQAVYDHVGSHSTKQQPIQSSREFIASEHYLVRTYYGWPRAGALLLLVYRWLEFALYVGVLSVSHWWKCLRSAQARARSADSPI